MKNILSNIALLLILPLLILSLMNDFSAQFQSEEVSTVMNDTVITTMLAENPALETSAKHAVLITANGHIIYGKNENVRAEMASCTKIMTALLAIEYLNQHSLDEKTTVSKNAVGIEGSSIYLEEGEEVTLLDLIYALMLASANDAAIAIAEAVSGTEEAFVTLMNEKSVSLGLPDTHFDNPHGLSSDTHYTTAYSLARLMAHAMEDPLFARITATKRYTMKNGDTTRYLSNHNRLLSSYSNTVGGKTGFTKRAGRCLVSAAEYNGTRLIAVTLSAPDDWNDHQTMYRYGFENWEAVEIPAEYYELPVVAGETKTVTVSSEATRLILPKARGELTVLCEAPRFLYAPIAQSDTIGKITIHLSGKTVAILPLRAEKTVKEEKKKGFFEKLFS